MKTKKRFLSILLSLVLMLGLMIGMSATAYADPGQTHTYNIKVRYIDTVVKTYTLAGEATLPYSTTTQELVQGAGLSRTGTPSIRYGCT